MRWLILLICLAGAPGSLMEAEQTQPLTQNPTTVFATQYNEWIMINQSRVPGEINARELQAWNRTKARWKELQRVIDASY